MFWCEDPAHENVYRCSYLESKTKPSVTKAQINVVGSLHRKKCILGGGDAALTFLTGELLGWGKKIYWEGGTPHILC